MLNSSARALLFERPNSHVRRIADVRPSIRQIFDPRPIGNSMLKCYLEGWAEANSAKILAATAPGYHFRDPFVGSFFRPTLHEYFDLLQDRLSRAGVMRLADVAFFLNGPMGRPSEGGGLQFWREAPRIGLTGVTEIEVREQGVIAERVVYDLNLASDTLRRGF
jgi:hypothetical protein